MVAHVILVSAQVLLVLTLGLKTLGLWTLVTLLLSLDLSKGGLDVEALHILQVLLQQRHEEVHGQ